MDKGISGLNQDVKDWVRKNDLPVDYDFLLNLAIIDRAKADVDEEGKVEREEEASRDQRVAVVKDVMKNSAAASRSES